MKIRAAKLAYRASIEWYGVEAKPRLGGNAFFRCLERYHQEINI